MKKFLLFMLLLMAIFINSYGQTPQFYNNFSASPSSNSFPLNSTTSNQVQWIYAPGVFNSAGTTGAPAFPGLITTVYFRLSAANATSTYTNYTISLGQNVGTINSFANTTFITGLTQCFFQQSFQMTGAAVGWYAIPLQTPFLYDPSQSLVFELKVSAGTGNSVGQENITGFNHRIWGLFGSTTGSTGTGLVNFGFDLIPATPCTTPPVAGTTIASQNPVCQNGNVNLNLTGATIASGLTYQWQSSPDSLVWTNIAGATQNFYTATVAAPTFYRCEFTCSSVSAASVPVRVNTTGGLPGGTYTIGPSGNYTTLTQAVNALSCGILGPVVFNVTPNSGPYAETMNIPSLIGSSAINTVTFNFNNNLINVAPGTSNIGIVTLNGADNITFNDMKITSIGTGAVVGVLATNQANDITLNNCEIDVSSATTTISAGVATTASLTSISIAGNTSNNLAIYNSTIRGGFASVRFNGQATTFNSGYVVSGCTLLNFQSYGVFAVNASNCIINNNDISRPVANQTSSFYGIWWATGGNNNLIESNKIHSSNNTTVSTNLFYGISFSSCDAPIGSENKIYNNIIYRANNSGTIWGIYNTGSDGFWAYHNTVAVNEPQVTGTGTFRGLYQVTTATNVIFRNNIVTYNRGTTGLAHNIYFGTTASTITSNNNVFFNTAGANQHIGFYSTNQTTLAAWQAVNSSAYDQLSVVADPQYLNYVSGALVPNNGAINNLGAPLGVAFDIQGNIRSATTPDVGAFEFTPATQDIGVASLSGLASPCPIPNDTLNVTVVNSGAQAIDFSLNPFTINWTVSGPIVSNGTLTINSGVLNPQSTQVYQVSTAVNVSTVGTYTASATISASWDLQPLNNSNSIPLNKTVIGINAFANPASIFAGQSSNLNVQSGLLNTFLITEITLFQSGTGNNSATLPTYSGTWSDDKFELTNVGTTALNISGYQVDFYGSTTGTFTFPNGTIVPPNGVVVVGMGTGPNQPASFIFRSGLGGDTWSSGTLQGLVLRNQSIILDVLATNGYVFPAAAGVTPALWSGTASSPSGVAGCGRTGSDNNVGSDWLPATVALQTIGTLNNGLTVGINPNVSWTGPNNFNGTGSPLSTGILPTAGQQVFTASLSAGGCTYTDTARVNVIPPPTNEIASEGLANPLPNGCYSATEPVVVKVRNTSLVQAINFSTDTLRVGVQVSGAATTLLTATISNNLLNGGQPLAMNAVVNVPVGTVNMSTPGTYTFKAWAKVAGDGFINNDTFQLESITILPVSASALKDTICLGDSVTLNFTGFSGPMSWEANTGSGWNAISSSPVITVTPAVATQYRGLYCINRTTNVLNIVPISVPQPTITNGNVCFGGSGTVSATGVGGSISWFSTATGGLPLVTNNSYTANNVTAPVTVFAQNNFTTGASGLITIGTGTAVNTPTGYPTPYGNFWWGAKHQLLYRASELQAMGVTSAGTITSIAFNITALNAVPTLNNFTIRIGQTAVNALAVATPVGGLTTVVAPTNYTPVVGWNTHNFSTPFNWDGVSNIVIELCFNNSSFISNGNASVALSTTTFNSSIWRNADNATNCIDPFVSVSTQRPNARFNINTGCASTRVPAQLNVLPVPTVSIPSNVAYCAGSSTTVDAGQGFISYSWSNGDTSQIATVNQSGLLTVTITDTTGCSNTDTANVSALAIPIINLGNDTAVCSNSGFQLDAGFGFAGYLWSNGSNNQIVNVNTSGSIFVTVTDTNNCSGTDTIIVSVNQAPEPQLSDVEICDGQSVTLNPGTASNLNYIWSTGAQTPTLTVTIGGNYIVTVTDANNCSGSATAIVNVNSVTPLSLGNNQEICFNYPFTLQAPSGFASYQWFDGSTNQTLNIAPNTFAPGSVQSIWVIGINAEGCESTDTIQLRINACTGFDEVGGIQNIQVYPNPNNGSFNLAINSLQSMDELNIEIVSLHGQTIYNERLQGVKDLNHFIRLNQAASGMYILKLSGNQFMRTYKIEVK